MILEDSVFFNYLGSLPEDDLEDIYREDIEKLKNDIVKDKKTGEGEYVELAVDQEGINIKTPYESLVWKKMAN